MSSIAKATIKLQEQQRREAEAQRAQATAWRDADVEKHLDAIATAAEEAKDPDRDLKIGIVGSMLACVAIYILVAVAAVGALVAGNLIPDETPEHGSVVDPVPASVE